MAIAWASEVNTDAYGMETDGGDNVERVEFESGKNRTYLKNTSPKKVHAFMLSMDDVGVDSEFKKFVYWFENSLKSGALSFMFPDLVTHTGEKEYRLIGSYSASGQHKKEISLTVEEM